MAKTLKILHFTTHDEECGIAKYQEQFLQAMVKAKGVQNTIFPYSPNRTKIMSKEEFAPVLAEFAHLVKDYDILHIQHEFSFYSKDELQEIVSEAKRQGKKVIVTVHTSLHAGIPKIQLKQLARRGVRHMVGTRRLKNYLLNVHVEPLKKADLVLAHNSVTADSLASYGVSKSRIRKITMPVPQIDFSLKSTEVTKRLKRQKGDVIYCTVGFLSATKGIKDAVKALSELPANYKLAMIGGKHPSGANDVFCDEVEGLVKQLGLSDRAYISGYVKADERLNAMIRECDICVYPFDQAYYAGVTSASLNNSLANFKPAITYPTEPIKEMNTEMPAVITCQGFDYRYLVKELETINAAKQGAVAKAYAEAFAYDKQATLLISIYKSL